MTPFFNPKADSMSSWSACSIIHWQGSEDYKCSMALGGRQICCNSFAFLYSSSYMAVVVGYCTKQLPTTNPLINVSPSFPPPSDAAKAIQSRSHPRTHMYPCRHNTTQASIIASRNEVSAEGTALYRPSPAARPPPALHSPLLLPVLAVVVLPVWPPLPPGKDGADEDPETLPWGLDMQLPCLLPPDWPEELMLSCF